MNHPKPHRLTAADFHPEVLKLFDQYVHGDIDRRGFLDRRRASPRQRHHRGRPAGGAEPATSRRRRRSRRPTRASRPSASRFASPQGHGKVKRAGGAPGRPRARCRWCW